MDDLINIRHHLHAHPELSGEENETRMFIMRRLEGMGITQVRNTSGNHSILAEIHKSGSGPVVLFRCELDALPIAEINDFSHRSVRPNIAHKCGHDGHMVIMLGFIRNIIKNPPGQGTILALFQSAEETGEGAEAIIKSGILDRYSIDHVFALHNIPGYPLGSVICRPGSFTPAVESISIELQGRTSHAGEPEKGINPAGVLGHIITHLNGLHNPDKSSPEYCVSTPIHIQMGEEAYGTSAGHAWIRYTFRTWTNERLNQLKRSIEQEVKRAVSMKEGLQYSTEWKQPFNSNNNHEDAVTLVRMAAHRNQLAYIEKEDPFDWGEDFGLFTEQYKGAMFGLGAGENCPALHNPDYDFPDELIAPGIRMFEQISRSILPGPACPA